MDRFTEFEVFAKVVEGARFAAAAFISCSEAATSRKALVRVARIM
jgi:hypothetical protein